MQIGDLAKALQSANECYECCLKVHGTKSMRTFEVNLLLADIYRALSQNNNPIENMKFAFERVNSAIKILSSRKFRKFVGAFSEAYYSRALNFIVVEKYDDALYDLQKSIDIIGQKKIQ